MKLLIKNKMKTAVEWLRDHYLLEMKVNGEIHLDLLNKLFDQAKEMEKQQMCDFAIDFMMQDRPVVSYWESKFKIEQDETGDLLDH
jgi:hypothetical protein